MECSWRAEDFESARSRVAEVAGKRQKSAESVKFECKNIGENVKIYP